MLARPAVSIIHVQICFIYTKFLEAANAFPPRLSLYHDKGPVLKNSSKKETSKWDFHIVSLESAVK